MSDAGEPAPSPRPVAPSPVFLLNHPVFVLPWLPAPQAPFLACGGSIRDI